MDEQNVFVRPAILEQATEIRNLSHNGDDGSPVGWKVMRLQEAANTFDKKRVPLNESQRQTMRGPYPYCGANGILDYVKDYLFDGEYILLAEDGGYWGAFESSAYLMRGRFWVNNHAHIIQAIPGVADNSFLVYLLNYLDIDRFISGTTRGKLTQGVMQDIPLPLPPLPEQRTIAHTLRTVQEAIQARRREADLERERKATLMQHLFTYGTRSEPTKQTELGERPESWREAELGKVADIVYGVQAAVAHLLDSSSGIPILTNVNVGIDGTLDLSTLRYYEVPAEKREKLLLRRGDILFNWRSGSQAHVGKTVLFDLEGEYTFSSFILRFRTNKQINNEFLCYYLQWLRAGGFFAQNRQQSSINSVFNASIAATIPVVIPSLSEQQEIARTLNACNDKIAALDQETRLVEELFRALLEDLMTGRLSTAPLVTVEVAQ